jgi:Protein of unknown function (DUF3237)
MLELSVHLELVSRLRVYVAEAVDAGTPPAGHRRILPIIGGTAEGPGFSGEVLPIGADWSLVRADGVPTVSAKYLVRTTDRTVLTVHNEGILHLGDTITGITRPSIEAPAGAYSWLNDAVLVGTLTPLDEPTSRPGVSLAFYRAVT